MTARRIRWWLFGLVVLAAGALWAYGAIAVRGTFDAFQPATDAPGSAIAAGADGHRIVGRLLVRGAPEPAAPLVVLLHGDAPFRNPGYQYGVARQIADAVPGTRVVALVRPGYADTYGARSDGDRGSASGQNYTADVIEDLAAAIGALKSRWHSRKVVLVGHSGGAAITADVAALHPGLVDHAVLVACPCDVPAFRRHMARSQWSPTWLWPSESLSPMDTLARMPSTVRVTAVSGTDDDVTLPAYAQRYVAAAKARGMAADYIEIPKRDHEIFDDPVVVDTVAGAVRASK